MTVTCPTCGEKILGQADACPGCSLPRDRIQVCPDCRTTFLELPSACQKCGRQLSPMAELADRERIEAVRKMRQGENPMTFKEIADVLGCKPQEVAKLARIAESEAAPAREEPPPPPPGDPDVDDEVFTRIEQEERARAAVKLKIEKEKKAETATEAKKKAEEAGKKAAKIMLGCGLLLGVCIIFGLLLPDDVTQTGIGGKIEAMAIAQQFVEGRLSSPSTADWPWVSADDVVVDLGGGRYRVTSYVDSQNAFGGTIRTHYVCVLRRNSGGTGWTLEGLTTR